MQNYETHQNKNSKGTSLWHSKVVLGLRASKLAALVKNL